MIHFGLVKFISIRKGRNSMTFKHDRIKIQTLGLFILFAVISSGCCTIYRTQVPSPKYAFRDHTETPIQLYGFTEEVNVVIPDSMGTISTYSPNFGPLFGTYTTYKRESYTDYTEWNKVMDHLHSYGLYISEGSPQLVLYGNFGGMRSTSQYDTYDLFNYILFPIGVYGSGSWSGNTNLYVYSKDGIPIKDYRITREYNNSFISLPIVGWFALSKFQCNARNAANKWARHDCIEAFIKDYNAGVFDEYLTK